jgi:hypothetical protein
MKTEEKIKELEKQIKELKKEVQKEEMEQWFKSLLNGLEIGIDDDRPDSIYYKKNGIYMFKLYIDPNNKEKRHFYCNYELVGKILLNKYNLNEYEIQKFVSDMVERYLKLIKVIPLFG